MIITQESEWHAIQRLIQPNKLDAVNYTFAFHNPTIALLIWLTRRGDGGLQPLRPYHN